MTIRIAINGFGRMGRLGFRAGWDRDEYDIVRVNEIAGDAACMAHLLEFDSVHGRWARDIQAEDGALRVDDKVIAYSRERAPAAVDWQGIDLLIDCTGKFKTAQALQPYFDQGVKKVLVSAPVPDPALNV
ncbi:MAG: glyceraldehyde 3-phosphate dehydrogenase NAD-binding domain-containing protein, partial [Gammaproteobacteria bacterium]